MEEIPTTDARKSAERRVRGRVHAVDGAPEAGCASSSSGDYENPLSQLDSLRGIELDKSLWKATVESMLDPVTVCDAEGHAIYMNTAYSRLAGYEIGQDVPLDQHAVHYKLYRPDGTIYDYLDLPLQRAALRDEEVRGAEVVQHGTDGQPIYMVWNASPIHSSTGAVVGAVAVGRNVTDQRRAHEMQALLASIVESSDDAILGKTLDGIITSWNLGAQRLYGYSSDEIVGKSVTTIVPPEGIPEFQDIMARLARGEHVHHLETTRRRKDGTTVIVSLTISPILGHDGRIVGASTVARDVTAQRQAQEAERFLAEASTVLSESLEYEGTLQRIADIAVPRLCDLCIIDVIDGQNVRQRASSLDGRAHDKRLSAIQAEYSLDLEGTHPILEVMQTGAPRRLATWSSIDRHPDGYETLPAAMVRAGVETCLVVPLVIRGRPVGAISLISVNAQRSYSEASLQLATEFASRAAVAIDNAKLYQDAKNAVTARDQFLSVAAHELKTPMTSLRGFVQLAMRQMSRNGELDPAMIHQAMRVIDQQSHRLAALISQLLDVTRLEAGRLSLERRIVDLSGMVEGAVAVAAVANTEHLFTMNIQPGVLALVDPVRIEQVVSALLENATRFSPPGTRISITLSQPSPEAVRITVRDAGPGVPPEQRRQIFTRFYHGHPNEHAGGMGLGLYMSREIVLLHGGTIEAEFPEEGGSLFVVTLPVALGEYIQ